jgi:heme exporter protein B
MVLALLKKEFAVEARRLNDVLSIVFFDVILTFIFSSAYAIGTGSDGMPLEVYAVQTWLIAYFTVLYVVSRQFPTEKDSGTLNGLLVAPVSPFAIFFCKIIVSFVIIGLIETVQVILSILISRPDVPLFSFSTLYILVLGGFALPILDLAIAGTLISAFSMYARHKSFLLPVLLFPVLIPVVSPILSSFIVFLNGTLVDAVAYNILFVAAHAILMLSITALVGKEVLVE